MDFTIKLYKKLLEQFRKKQYQFLPYVTFMKQRFSSGDFKEISSQSHNSFQPEDQINDNVSNNRFIIIRHDVDRLPENSLKTAVLEHELGIQGTYYFRIVPESFNLQIMEKISKLGQEIGYHYEDIDLVLKQKQNAKKFSMENLKRNPRLKEILLDLAYESFVTNLEMLRKNFDIKTICMHGSPLSPYDNKWIWEKYNYKQLGILGEPYLDMDWTTWAYYTDTGRRWDGFNVSVRDKVNHSVEQNKWPVFSKTDGLISAVINGNFPDRAMITIHPQRWTNNPLLWGKELFTQSVKNVIKSYIIKKSKFYS